MVEILQSWNSFVKERNFTVRKCNYIWEEGFFSLERRSCLKSKNVARLGISEKSGLTAPHVRIVNL